MKGGRSFSIEVKDSSDRSRGVIREGERPVSREEERGEIFGKI